jgi:thiamine-phosphate pyrophosphorylase
MKISKIHYITQGDLKGFTHADLTLQACKAGLDWVQLRYKEDNTNWLNTALDVQSICKSFNATFIINDNPELALKVNADGVHLGKTDMNPIKARALLGNDFIIGGSANTLDDVKKLVEARVDYIGMGPFRFTTTKSDLNPIIALNDYLLAIDYIHSLNLNVPIIAIGGIQLSDLPTIIENRIYGVAVASVISKSENPQQTIAQFLKCF